MTLQEFILTNCDNYHATFKLDTGEHITGVITTFFHDLPTEYYLVRTRDLIKFRELHEANQYDDMRLLAKKVDFSKLVSAKRIWIKDYAS